MATPTPPASECEREERVTRNRVEHSAFVTVTYAPTVTRTRARQPRTVDTSTLVRGHIPAGPLGVMIRVLGAHSTPKVLRLGEGTAIVGAAPDCDLSISDPS